MKQRKQRGRFWNIMEEREMLKNSILQIKGQLKEQKEDLIKLGLYMALQIIKDNVLEEDLLKELGLEEDLEKYLQNNLNNKALT